MRGPRRACVVTDTRFERFGRPTTTACGGQEGKPPSSMQRQHVIDLAQRFEPVTLPQRTHEARSEVGAPVARSYVTLAEHPSDMVRLACTKCERRGQYRLLAEFDQSAGECVGVQR